MTEQIPPKTDSEPESVAPSTESEAEDTGDGLLANASALISEYRAVATSHFKLAALETKKAGESLVLIVALGVISGVLAVTSWLAMVAAATLALIELTALSPAGAIFLMAALNILIALGLLVVIFRQSRALLFSAIASNLAPDKEQTDA
ncbi:hypothetical protein CWE09_00905 [Aliidiomarina minuta]|uniref:Phage holin family protein n=1 Tax=Aliidiomarina minuta TaxID=880057 RepID=A0A432W5R6_9GAMM|nr:phage holin family protein [Aliidiomarina minuta]RUO25326.1 hypothetical protein CWE09_00905 [Aliidiomarina minuta]